MASLLERTAARVRGEFARWPDGEHDAEALLDHDGADRSKPVRIKVTARKRGERLTLDFSGTDAQAKGPVNTPGPTAQAVSLLAVIAASDPDHPDEFRRARRGRFRHAAGHAGQPAIPGEREPLFPDLARGLHLRARRARQVQSGARGGARRFRHRRDRDRLQQGPRRQADRAIRADGDLARRHQHPRRNVDRAADEPFHARARRSRSSRPSIR